jgi:hypothetical protein
MIGKSINEALRNLFGYNYVSLIDFYSGVSAELSDAYCIDNNGRLLDLGFSEEENKLVFSTNEGEKILKHNRVFKVYAKF